MQNCKLCNLFDSMQQKILALCEDFFIAILRTGGHVLSSAYILKLAMCTIISTGCLSKGYLRI